MTSPLEEGSKAPEVSGCPRDFSTKTSVYGLLSQHLRLLSTYFMHKADGWSIAFSGSLEFKKLRASNADEPASLPDQMKRHQRLCEVRQIEQEIGEIRRRIETHR